MRAAGERPWRGLLRAWGPPCAWAALIFIFSTDAFSGEHTRRWIEMILRAWMPAVSRETVELSNFAARKVGHVSEYFVFVLLLDRAFGGGRFRSGAGAALRALAVAVLYSLSDEAHQAFVKSRTASLVDCGWDSLGAALAALARWVGLDPLWLGRR